MAFNIDIEAGPGSNSRTQVQLYCSSLTKRWVVSKEASEIVSFVKKLRTDKTLNTSSLPREPRGSDHNDIELALCQLGCNAAVLRSEKFQVFLDIPSDIRQGLKFVQQKPLGNPQTSTGLVKHARFVGKSGEKRWVVLTSNSKGASVAIYRKQGEKYPVSTLKLAPSVSFQVLPEIKNAFLLTSGKRQWILQAENQRDYSLWTTSLNKKLEELQKGHHGHHKSISVQKSKSNKLMSGFSKVGNVFNRQRTIEKEEKTEINIEQIKADNRKLERQIKDAKQKIETLNQTIKELERKERNCKDKEKTLRKEMFEDFETTKLTIKDEHNKNMAAITKEIEETWRQIEEKQRLEGVNIFSSVFAEEESKDEEDGANENNELEDEDMYLSKTDMELKKRMPIQQEIVKYGPQQGFSLTFRNMHKHDFVHIMNHRHTHVHDDTTEEEVVFTQTHTYAHTICHTSTVFSKKGRGLIG